MNHVFNIMLTKNQTLFLIFSICIITRVLSSIFYIEDIDSLRFALSVYEYDITKLQPHFPGYPIFSFFAKFIYFFIGNMGVTFSLIGGMSTFCIIYFLLKIADLKPNSPDGYFMTFLILLNPLLWLISNRYMPDIMGLAISISSLHFLLNSENNKHKVLFGFFLFGILAGIRLSYLPLLFIPAGYHLITKKEKIKLFLMFSIGCLIWLIPMISITGFNDLWVFALDHTSGHFNDYGGTIYTENNWTLRLTSFFRSIWADGFAGYWNHRSWITLIISFYLIYFFKGVFNNYKKIYKNNKIILYSILLYIIWVLLFQNIIFKTRHILPVLTILILMLSLGQTFTKLKSEKFKRYIHISYFSFLLSASLILVLQHKKPSAIAQLKSQFIKKETRPTIITIPLINYYLRSGGLKTVFINAEDQKKIGKFIESDFNGQAFMIGDFRNSFKHNFKITKDTTFYHNPYVNRMWSELDIYSLKKENIK